MIICAIFQCTVDDNMELILPKRSFNTIDVYKEPSWKVNFMQENFHCQSSSIYKTLRIQQTKTRQKNATSRRDHERFGTDPTRASLASCRTSTIIGFTEGLHLQLSLPYRISQNIAERLQVQEWRCLHPVAL